MGGASTVAELEAKLAESGHPSRPPAEQDATQIATDSVEAQQDLTLPPPPVDPSGPEHSAPADRSVGSERPRPQTSPAPRASPRRC